VLSRSQYGHH